MNLQPCPSIDERVTPAVASAELEVDVAYLLNQAKADRNKQVAPRAAQVGRCALRELSKAAQTGAGQQRRSENCLHDFFEE